jgi:general secretion pathway protein A
MSAVDDRARRPLLDLFPPSRPPQRKPELHADSPSDTATYESFYALREQPFSLSTDPKFLFHSAAHDKVAQELLTAIRRRDPLVAVTGNVGIGKTLLCRAVIEELDQRTLTSYLACPIASVEDLLATMLIDFGVVEAEIDRERLEQSSRGDLESALRHFLATLAPIEAHAVVLIDDAHGLSRELMEQVKLLSEFSGTSRLLQFVLVGQPALTARLRDEGLASLDAGGRIRCALEPLAPEEMIDYVSHRLSVAGASPRVDFSDAAADRLYQVSNGVPTLVNLLCDRALTLGFAALASAIDVDIVDAAVDDLELTPPEPVSRWLLRDAAIIIAFAVLVLAGAVAAARIFHEPLARLIVRWGQPSP